MPSADTTSCRHRALLWVLEAEMSKADCLAALIALVLYASAWPKAAAANPSIDGTAGGERVSW